MADDGSGIQVRVEGIADFVAALREIPRELRRKALLEALRAGGRIVRDEARRRAPVMRLSTHSGAAAFRRGIRTPGLLRKSISVRTSKVARRAGDVGVFVNVRPAATGNRGARSPRDPYYWRWQEFGFRARAGAGFLQAAGARLSDALRAMIQRLGPSIQKFNQRQGVRR
jgi:HK97 gp10 family phage protein